MSDPCIIYFYPPDEVQEGIYGLLNNLYGRLLNLTEDIEQPGGLTILEAPWLSSIGLTVGPSSATITNIQRSETDEVPGWSLPSFSSFIMKGETYDIYLEPYTDNADVTGYYINIIKLGELPGEFTDVIKFVVDPDSQIQDAAELTPAEFYDDGTIEIYFCDIGGLEPTDDATPTAPICFIRDTPVKTDQGEVKIQEINTDIHTINSKKILAITKTKLDGDLLVRVEKNAFAEDCPNHSVVMSGNHKILYNNELIMAKDLALNMPGKLNYMKYMGDTLYNVLMENHETMMVNNMVVETLHPENKIALLYRCLLKASNEERIETMQKYTKIEN
jgi:hypothetical protein